MKLKNITIEFTAEEIDAINYAMVIGIEVHSKKNFTSGKELIDLAREVEKKLPTTVRRGW